MSIFVPNNNDVKTIINYIEEALQFLEKTTLNINSSIDNLPSPIKNKIIASFNNLKTEVNDITKDCEFTITGINNNVQAYEESAGIEVLKKENSSAKGFSFVATTNGDMKQANANFFKGLSSDGNGIFDEGTGVYKLDSSDGKTYEYNVNNGSLKINGKRSSVVFGIYVPENTSDLSNLNTITFLHGDEDYGSKFYENHDLVESSVNNCPSDTILIFPQANTAGNNGKGFIPFSDDVVAGTEFVNELASQDNSQKNALVGFSSGFKSAYKISANEGKNTYDTVVGINGYVEPLTASEIEELKDKQLYMCVANNETTNVDAWNRRMTSLDTMYKSGLNPKIITGSDEYMNKADEYGFDVTFVGDEKFVGHGSGCKYAISKLDILHRFKG